MKHNTIIYYKALALSLLMIIGSVNYVWGYDYYGRENIIDVYMNYLRKKIDQDFSQKLIHTVRGAGYVMRVED